MNMGPQMNPPSELKFENVWNWPNTHNANLFISQERVIGNVKTNSLKVNQCIITEKQ